METKSLDKIIKKLFIYGIITFIIFVAVYFVSFSLNKNTVVEVKLKQSLPNPVSVLYYNNEYSTQPPKLELDNKSDNEVATYKFKIPNKYPYKINLYLVGSEEKPNEVYIENVKVSTLFSSMEVVGLDGASYVLTADKQMTLVDGYAFTEFQVTTKIKIVSFSIAILIVFVLRKQINKLLRSETNPRENLKVVVFAGTLFLVFFMNWFILDNKTSNLSGELEQKPTIDSYEDIVDTSFMKDFEAYLQSQIVYRESLVEDYYAYNRALQKNQFVDKYITELDNREIIFTTRTLDKNIIDASVKQIAQVDELLKEKGIPYYFYLAPTKEAYHREYFNDFVIDETFEIVDYFKGLMAENNIEVYDLFDVVKEGSEKEGFSTHFYTDHHWSLESVYYSYLNILNQLTNDGLVDFAESEFKAEVYEEVFAGSEARALAYGYRYNQTKDDFDLIYAEGGSYTISKVLDGKKERTGTFLEVMDMKYLNPLEKNSNSYAVYYSLINRKITNNNLDNDRTLVVLGDSYAAPIIFFFTQNFENVVYLDERWKVDEKDTGDTAVIDYLKNNEYDVVINLNNYNTLQIADLFDYFK